MLLLLLLWLRSRLTVGQRRATIGAGAGAAHAVGAAAGVPVLGAGAGAAHAVGAAAGVPVLGCVVLGSVVLGSAVLGSAVLGSAGSIGAAANGFESARGGRLPPTSEAHLRAGRDPRRASAIVLGRRSGRRSGRRCTAAVAAAAASRSAALAAALAAVHARTMVVGGRNEGTCRCGIIA